MKKLAKQELREKILNSLRNQKEEIRLRKSLIIQDKLFRMPAFNSAKIILFYASFNGEVNTYTMIEKALQLGKTVLLPKIDKQTKMLTTRRVECLHEDLEEGAYGIKEPKAHTQAVPLESVDFIVAPGVAFDKQNNRLGRGGGFYDRLLQKTSSSVITVGLAFDFQVVEHLPHTEEHDVKVQHVLHN